VLFITCYTEPLFKVRVPLYPTNSFYFHDWFMFFVLNKPSPRRGLLTGHRQLFSLTGSSGAAVFCIERRRHVPGSSPPSLSALSHHIHDRFAAAFVGPPHPRSSRRCLWLESPPGSRRRCIRDGFLSSLGSARRGRLGSARRVCLGLTSSSGLICFNL
jgi:hypothetical protein